MTDEPVGSVERKNRTIIATVVFADIASFSERSVVDQTTVKTDFNQVAARALQNVAEPDRLILDTGDGLAVCLFGDPADGLFVSLEMRDAYGSTRPVGTPDYEVRIGVNLGPIKVVTDLNSRYNAIGDGINVAQRLMGFASPGQVLCSRSYYEIVSRLSDDYSRLFEFLGVRHDKHVREHDVYEVRPPIASVSAPLELAADPVLVCPDLALDPALAENLTAVLAKYEGPVARILIKRACKGASSAEELVNAVAAGMHDKSEASEFLQTALALLS